MTLCNSAPQGKVTLDYAKVGVLNEDMRKKGVCHLHPKKLMLLKIGGEVEAEVQMAEIKVAAKEERTLNAVIVM